MTLPPPNVNIIVLLLQNSSDLWQIDMSETETAVKPRRPWDYCNGWRPGENTTVLLCVAFSLQHFLFKFKPDQSQGHRWLEDATFKCSASRPVSCAPVWWWESVLIQWSWIRENSPSFTLSINPPLSGWNGKGEYFTLTARRGKGCTGDARLHLWWLDGEGRAESRTEKTR